MNSMDSVRDSVVAYRKGRRLSQAEFAEAAGIPLRTYQSFESGEHKTQRDNLLRILRAAGLDPDVAPPATGEERAAETRDGWPADIQVFLDTLGAFLNTMHEAERLEFIHTEVRRIADSVADIIRG